MKKQQEEAKESAGAGLLLLLLVRGCQDSSICRLFLCDVFDYCWFPTYSDILYIYIAHQTINCLKCAGYVHFSFFHCLLNDS